MNAAAEEGADVRVGFIGLGNMGAPMARRLTDWPGGLVVCDARPEATEKFAAAGATVAATPAEAAETASVISVTVLDDTQVRDVVAGEHGILRSAKAGTVVAVHSTIADSTAIELAELCRAQGVDLVDAPVSGGAPGATQGRLAVMVGGSDTAFAAVRHPFRLWADLIVHAGDVGAGTRMKLARNLLHFVSFAAATEAARLAEAAGLDIRRLGEVVRHSDAVTGGPGAILWRDTTAALTPGDSWLPIMSHVRDLGEKDLGLALALGDRLGLDLPLARLGLIRLAEGLGLDASPVTEPNGAPR
ncbi:NAD(P)-dependent oxidoreductase [Nocardia puris]|uniref:3-hydroxyisobutyrate dehydrogenase n=1 Tax=Nocardia puris TaxID=208602 RepID=A0A366E146_9NOCA|nr:NAD(P)-dependent oxidoreductase [Nocardia puris]RBO96033.1 3-hydroxyisobutyrate dehydrogenase [Nocardia puris]